MSTPNTNLQTFWPKEVSREMSGITFCVCSTLWVSRCILVAISKAFSLSGWRAHCDCCHVETRPEHDLERWLTDGKSKTCQSGDAQSVQRGYFFVKFGISGQSGEWRWKKKGRKSTRELDARRLKIGSRIFPSESTREGSSSHQETGAEGSILNKKWWEPLRHKETCCILTGRSKTWNTGTFWRNSECGECLEYSSPSWTRSRISENDQERSKWAKAILRMCSTLTPFFVSDR